MDNKLTIAAAGSGKTTQLINESINITDSSVLITTYTNANADEIRQKFIRKHGCVPSNITIQTWFSLLIQHGVKPFQSCLFEKKVKGLLLVACQSGYKGKSRTGYPIYWGETDIYRYYFSYDMKVYSDKLSKLVCKINNLAKGKVIDRLTNIYPTIFIDECQDLAGYDLEIIKLLANNSKKLRLVCDPRQVTYLTHNDKKYKKYQDGLIHEFIQNECKKISFDIDSDSLSHSYRCNQLICNLSNKLYPEIHQCNSHQSETTGHDGIFLVSPNNVERYLTIYNPIQLRWNILEKSIHKDNKTYNFGESKGLTFDRVLIYPTKNMIEWLKDHNYNLANPTRAKFYVGITRAKYSVGIICDTSKSYDMTGINIFS